MFKNILLSGAVACMMLGAEHVNAETNKAYQAATIYKPTTESAPIIFDNMTLREKIGQLMMLDFRFWGVDKNGNQIEFTKMNSDVAKIISDYKIGGVILFRDNLHNTEQSIDLIQGFQNARSHDLPLLISTDQEGGYVTRLREGTEMPGNMAMAASRDIELARKAGQVHGLELSALGINFNFGPVVDVNTNQKNPIIGVRSYGSDLKLIDEMSGAYLKGIHQYNILSSAKHFPGHGNVSLDSHKSLPTVSYSEKQWRAVDLKAFENVFAQGVDSVMTAHVVVPSLDNGKLTSPLTGNKIGTPATFSKKILTGILRKELNYQGLIVTDALDMGAIANNFPPTWSIERTLLAGADIVLMPVRVYCVKDIKNIEEVYLYLENQVKKNPELLNRINDAALRVIDIKLKNNLSAAPVDRHHALKVVASVENKQAEKEVADRSVTLIENQDVLPFSLYRKTNVLVVSNESTRNSLIEDELNNIAANFPLYEIKADKVIVKMTRKDVDLAALRKKMKRADYIVVTTYNLIRANHRNAQKLIDLANKLNKPMVIIASRNPYDIAYLDNVKANIAIYGITGFDVTNNNRNKLEANIRAGIRMLFVNPETGKPINNPTAKLPVDIKSEDGKTIIYKFGHGLSY
jgi:beta-N-acetylhexosaminidase